MSLARINSTYDEAIKGIVEKMINHFEIRGSANLQMIVTADHQIVPFEVNCRISGTNSIRSNFGFEDVKYTIQEYLYNQTPDQPQIIPGAATRILMDVIYPGATSFDKLNDNHSSHFIY